MTAAEDRILKLYRAFNGRDFDGFFAMLAPDVDWPNDTDDTRLIGHDALRVFMLNDTAALRAEYAPIQTKTLSDGRVSVLAQQRIYSVADGTVWSDTTIRHTFRLQDDLVTRMDTERDIVAAPGGDALEPLLNTLFDAIDRRDIEMVMSVFHPDARIPDSLEQSTVFGREAIRAYYLRQFAAIQVASSLLSTKRLADDSVEAALHVLVRGSRGGFWWEGPVTATYQTRDGLIIDMDVAPEASRRN
jgi:hypothetical protein